MSMSSVWCSPVKSCDVHFFFFLLHVTMDILVYSEKCGVWQTRNKLQ